MTTREELTNMRRVLGMTQTELAQKAGISRLTVVKYEKGCAVRPSTEKAIRTTLRAIYDSTTAIYL